MLLTAAASNVPAWLAAVLVGVTALGAIANAVSGVVGGIFQIKRLEQMEQQRAQLDAARHAELLAEVRAEVKSQGEDHG